MSEEQAATGSQACRNVQEVRRLFEERIQARGNRSWPTSGGLMPDLMEDVYEYAQEVGAEGLEVGGEEQPGWAGAVSGYLEWLNRKAQLATRRNPGPVWDCRVQEVREGTARAVALGNFQELARESRLMQHSAVQYRGRCMRGESRVYRILEDGKHTGTGEIVPCQDGWKVAQVTGPRNRRPSDGARAVMEKAAREYSRA